MSDDCLNITDSVQSTITIIDEITGSNTTISIADSCANSILTVVDNIQSTITITDQLYNTNTVISVTEVGPIGPPGNNRADIYFDFYGPILISDSSNPLGIVVTSPLTVYANQSLAVAKTNANALTVFNLIRTSGITVSNVGTVSFAAGSGTGSISMSIGLLNAGDVFECVPPASPDPSLANIKITISGTR